MSDRSIEYLKNAYSYLQAAMQDIEKADLAIVDVRFIQPNDAGQILCDTWSSILHEIKGILGIINRLIVEYASRQFGINI